MKHSLVNISVRTIRCTIDIHGETVEHSVDDMMKKVVPAISEALDRLRPLFATCEFTITPLVTVRAEPAEPAGAD